MNFNVVCSNFIMFEYYFEDWLFINGWIFFFFLVLMFVYCNGMVVGLGVLVFIVGFIVKWIWIVFVFVRGDLKICVVCKMVEWIFKL